MTTRYWILATCLLATAAIAADDRPIKVSTLGSDRFVAGGKVQQTEPVQGDLIAAGGRVRVESAVGGDLLAAGGRVLVDGTIARNVRAAGGRVEIGEKAVLQGNASLAGGRVVVRGPVKGYLQAAGGEVLIDAAIDGDVSAASGKLTLGPNARIGGSLTYRSGQEMQRDPAAQVAGAIEYVPSAAGVTHAKRGNRWTRGWFWTAGLVVLALLLAGAMPAIGQRIGGELRAHPWMSLLAGFIAFICVPAAAIIVMITIIGIPLGLLALLLYVALLIVAYVATAVTLGDLALGRARPDVAARTGWRMLAAALAVLVLALLARIPVIGGLVVLAAVIVGMGAIALALSSRARAAGPTVPPSAAAAV